MSFTPANPTGWNPYDPVTADQLNHIDDQLVQAVDGTGGGTYSGPINLTGCTGIAGTGDVAMVGDLSMTSATFTADVECADVLCESIEASGSITMTNPAGNINMSGGAIATGGGAIGTSGGGVSTGGGNVTTSGGSINTSGGSITSGSLVLSSTTAITYPSSSFTKPLSMKPVYGREIGTYSELPYISGGPNVTRYRARVIGNAAVDDSKHVVWELDLPIGSALSSVTVYSKGLSHAGPTWSLPTLWVGRQLITSEADVEWIGSEVQDTSPSYESYHSHSWNLITPHTIQSDYKYLIRYVGEQGVNASTVYVYALKATYSRTTVPMGGIA